MADAQDISKGRVEGKTSSMDSNFPVLLPEDPCLRMEPDEFKESLFSRITDKGTKKPSPGSDTKEDAPPTPETTLELRDSKTETSGNTFADAMNKLEVDPTHLEPNEDEFAARNRALTDNNGMAFKSTESELVNLFHDLTGKPDSSIGESLDEAWEVDSHATLKIIWNCRSIHLGKGEKDMFYAALGWLGQNHPKTLLANLQWLFRGVIKKDAKPRPGDDDTAVVENLVFDLDDYDVVHGVSHGYWKDLLNILVLSAGGKLDMSDPGDTMRESSKTRRQAVGQLDMPPPPEKKAKLSDMSESEKEQYIALPQEERLKETRAFNALQKEHAKLLKRAWELSRHKKLLEQFENDPLHRALHYTTARFFAEQLKKDMHILEVGTKEQQKQISLCAKWAPSLERFHDKHTLIATTIAEMLYPFDKVGQEGDSRETYLKRAREKYRSSILSPLRKALKVVERDITSNSFSNIQYNQVPSIAMNQYKEVFGKKDHDRFLGYLMQVAKGKQKISGGVLMPGPMVNEIRRKKSSSVSVKVLEAQWQTLVQRIKDSGSLSDSMAVCDLSGSMTVSMDPKSPTLMDIAIALSIIVSSVTKPPFGNRIISFSSTPELVHVPASMGLQAQVNTVMDGPMGYSTNFVAVFRRLILPLAIENKVKPEDMVKRIFVFSDMQFDEAQSTNDKWATHHQIIKQEFEAAGYELPELVYWDLAGFKRSQDRSTPVTRDTTGTALVTGHSQAMLKTFLEGGTFEEGEEDEVVVDEAGDDGDDWGVVGKKKAAMTPLDIVRKTIGHKSYAMLTVVD